MDNEEYFNEHKEKEIKRLECKNALLSLQMISFELTKVSCKYQDKELTEENKNNLVSELVRVLKLITTYSTEVLHSFDIPQEMIEEELRKPVNDKIKLDIDNLPKPEEPKDNNPNNRFSFKPLELSQMNINNNSDNEANENCVHCQLYQDMGKHIPYCDIFGVLGFTPCKGCVKFKMRTKI